MSDENTNGSDVRTGSQSQDNQNGNQGESR